MPASVDRPRSDRSRSDRTASSGRPAGGGFVSPWENGSPLYRRLVLTGSGLFLVGIVLAVVGSMTERLPVSWTALAVLGLGVLVHLSAQTLRFREAARHQASFGPQRPGSGR